MPRDRHQKGHVYLRGKKPRWYGRYHVYENTPEGERRICKNIPLGRKSEMKKWEAEAGLQARIDSETGQGPKTITGITLRWFYENRYKLIRKRKLRKSSYGSLCWAMETQVLPVLGDKLLSDITKFDCESLLDGMSEKDLSFSAVHKAKTYLKATLDEAVDNDLLGKNPARKLGIPRTKEVDKRFLDTEEVQRLFSALGPRDRLMLRLLLVCGLRRGELFGLRWNDWTPGHLRIDEAVWCGELLEPKTKASKAPVYLPAQIEKELKEWKDTSKPANDQAFLWPGTKTGKPLDPAAWYRWHLNGTIRAANTKARKKDPKAAQLPYISYQILRRTFATQMQKCGTVKDIQRMMRHATPQLTAEVYMQPIGESVKAAVETLDAMLFGWLEKAEETRPV